MTPDRDLQLSIDNEQRFLAFLCDHLVVLAGTYVALDEDGRNQGEDRVFALPGFAMMVGAVYGAWSRRAIPSKSFEDGLADGHYRLTNCCVLRSSVAMHRLARRSRSIPRSLGDSR